MFVAGLKKVVAEIWGRIFRRTPFPSIREVFYEVHREEAQRQVMLKGVEELKIDPDGSALVACDNEQQGDR